MAPVTSKSGSVTDSTVAAGASNSGPANNGEEIKDLWIFHFSELPDLSASVSSELRGIYIHCMNITILFVISFAEHTVALYMKVIATQYRIALWQSY